MGAGADLCSPMGLGRAVVAMLGAVIVTDVANSAAAVKLLTVLASTGVGDVMAYDIDEAETAELLLGFASGLQRLTFLATAVVFIVWFHRVTRNAGAFAPDLPAHGPGWAIGGWFVPVAQLWIPRGIAAQVWQASRKDPYTGREHASSTLLNVWWGSCIAVLALSCFAEWRFDMAESPKELFTATATLVLADVLDTAAAVLAIRLVHKLTQMQHAKALRGPEPVAV
ncbi:DUF4328 domain-containing protein [Streptomyces sp. NPDC002889]|uniref:DUF4328 domain-containing protein n=1 Tax=Streptomyces sp. NPDC002889 TaxID=3364669 RepID=UPI003687C87E